MAAMASPRRIEYPGAVYHVLNRGNRGRDIYHDERDRTRFLALLERAVAERGWRCHAYCLMGNHYHLLIETPAADLGAGMQVLGATYTRWHNWRHGDSGHLFQGRYKAILVDKQAYLLELARYLALNPVRAGLVARPDDWPWSSYGAMVGKGRAPPWLARDWLSEQFGPRPAVARRRFAAFVAEGGAQRTAWQPDARHGILGDNGFRGRLERQLGRAVPARNAEPDRPSLQALAEAGQPRGAWMSLAKRVHGYRLHEIAAFAGVNPSTVSRIIAAWTPDAGSGRR